MRTSEQINEIAGALAKAQGEIANATKDSSNPHFKTKYADLASVREAVQAPLSKHGIAVVQGVRTTGEGVEVETLLAHGSGQWLAETLTIPLGQRSAQAVGSAISYGRRYSLMAIVGIAADDDDGNEATASPPPPRREPEPDRAPRAPAAADVNEDAIAYMARFRTAMRACESEDDLRSLWTRGKTDRRDARLTQTQCDMLLHEMQEEVAALKIANDQGRMLEAGE